MAINYDEDIIYNIDVDFHSLRQMETVYSKQYDENTRWIVATVWKDGGIYTIPDGSLAYFACTKPKGLGIFNPCTIIDNKIHYEITLQTTIESGSFGAEFRLYRTETIGEVIKSKKLASPNFKMHIDKSALDDSTVISTNEFGVLTNAITMLGDLIIDANTAISNANTATTNANTATTNANNAEAIRVTQENTRIQKDLLRLDYFYKTQAQYDALPQTDKDNPKNVYEITDNDGELPTELQTLLTGVTLAKNTYDSAVTNDTNLEVIDARNGEVSLNARISKIGKILISTFTANSTVTNITHNLVFVASKDDLLAVYRGVILEVGSNYSLNTNSISIDLLGWSILVGEKISFKIYKNVK